MEVNFIKLRYKLVKRSFFSNISPKARKVFVILQIFCLIAVTM
jgi:hypothetical protein